MPDNNKKDEQLLQKIERRVDSHLPVRDDLLNDLADLQATPDSDYSDALESRLLALAYQQQGEKKMQKVKQKNSDFRFSIPATFAAVIALVIIGIGIAGLLIANQNRINNQPFAAPPMQQGAFEATATAIVQRATQEAQGAQGIATATPMPSPTFVPTALPPTGQVGSSFRVLQVDTRVDTYAEPNRNTPSNGTLAKGAIVEVFDDTETNGLILFRYRTAYGWVQTNVLQSLEDSDGNAVNARPLIVSAEVAQLRNAANAESPPVATLSAETIVYLIEPSDDGRWIRVAVRGEPIGWLQSTEVRPVNSVTYANLALVRRVAAETAYIQAEPNTASRVLRVLRAGAIINLVNGNLMTTPSGLWYQVWLDDGTTGWILNDSLQELGLAQAAPSDASNTSAQVVNPFELTATALIVTATQGAATEAAQRNTSAQVVNASPTFTPSPTVTPSSTPVNGQAAQTSAQVVNVTPTFTPSPTPVNGQSVQLQPTVLPSTALPPSVATETRAGQWSVNSARIVFHEDLEVVVDDEVQIFAAMLLANWDEVGSLDAAEVTLDDLLRTETPLITIDEPAQVARIVENPDGTKLYTFNVSRWDLPMLEWVSGTNIPFVIVVMTEEQIRALQEQS